MDNYLAHCTHLENVFHACGVKASPTQATRIHISTHTTHIHMCTHTQITGANWRRTTKASLTFSLIPTCLILWPRPPGITPLNAAIKTQWCTSPQHAQLLLVVSKHTKFIHIKAVFMVTCCERVTLNLRVHVVQSSDGARLKKNTCTNTTCVT